MPHSETIKLAIDLIQRPSVTPEDAGCQEMLGQRLQQAGFTCQSMRFHDVDNLWATIGSEGPLFVFLGHTDVVPTGPESSWQHAPFLAHIEGDLLYGRGSADMKGSVASFITAAERFVTIHPDFKGRLGILLTSDEEGIAQYGIKAVMPELSRQDINIDYCLVGEPSSTAILGDVIKVGRRGSLNGTLTIIGKQGHIAYPHLADNPIHKLGQLIDRLTQEPWDNGTDVFDPTSFQISNLHAGNGATNVTPESVEMVFNFRFSPILTAEVIQQRFEAILKALKIQYTLNWQLSGNPFVADNEDFIALIETAVTEVTQRKPKRSTSGGTSDGRFVAPTGAQVVELGPINATIHQIDEHVSISDLEQLSVCYEKILQRVFTAS